MRSTRNLICAAPAKPKRVTSAACCSAVIPTHSETLQSRLVGIESLPRVYLSRSEAVSILTRGNESFDHLRINVITIEGVKFSQPKVVAGIIECCFGRIVRVPSQVTKILHQHKRAIEFLRP